MARARNLKPSFFLNTDLAKIEPLGRLLFAGLWCLADRSGRLEDNSLKIKAQLLPYDEADVEKLLTLLHTTKLIIRYKKRDDKYIQIVNFSKHQYPHIKEPESTIPAPYNNSVVTVPNRPLPPSPIPKHLNAESLWFETLWQAYPKQEGKKQALRHLSASVVSESDFQACARAIQNYKAKILKEKIEFKFVQKGSTFFNNWKDYENYQGELNEPKSERLNPYYDNEPYR